MVKAASKWLATQPGNPLSGRPKPVNGVRRILTFFLDGTVLRFFLHCAAVPPARINNLFKRVPQNCSSHRGLH
jgi:hypothetical protein